MAKDENSSVSYYQNSEGAMRQKDDSINKTKIKKNKKKSS
jgi:hypothetical protein